MRWTVKVRESGSRKGCPGPAEEYCRPFVARYQKPFRFCSIKPLLVDAPTLAFRFDTSTKATVLALRKVGGQSIRVVAQAVSKNDAVPCGECSQTN